VRVYDASIVGDKKFDLQGCEVFSFREAGYPLKLRSPLGLLLSNSAAQAQKPSQLVQRSSNALPAIYATRANGVTSSRVRATVPVHR